MQGVNFIRKLHTLQKHAKGRWKRSPRHVSPNSGDPVSMKMMSPENSKGSGPLPTERPRMMISCENAPLGYIVVIPGKLQTLTARPRLEIEAPEYSEI